MNKRAIADAGLFVAYLDPDDQHHDWAVKEFERFAVFDTCEAVVAEAGHLYHPGIWQSRSGVGGTGHRGRPDCLRRARR
jgi:predicted nucleic acid-binding protein